MSAALNVLSVGAGSASTATDHVVITGGAVVPAGRIAGDVVVLDGAVRVAGRATGDVVPVSGSVRVTGRVDGDLIAVSDRAFLGPTARVGGDLRYGDERPVLASGPLLRCTLVRIGHADHLLLLTTREARWANDTDGFVLSAHPGQSLVPACGASGEKRATNELPI